MIVNRSFLAGVAVLSTLVAVAFIAVAMRPSASRPVSLFSLRSVVPSSIQLRMTDAFQHAESTYLGLPSPSTSKVKAGHQAHQAAEHLVNAAHKEGKVAYVYMPDSGKATPRNSRLQHLAAQVPVDSSTMLDAPPPGVVTAPPGEGGALCDIWSLEKMSDDTQESWDKCMTNKDYQEPNSIAQEIFDELDNTNDGEVTPKEYCEVARKHSAHLTDDQCKEIIRLMDEAAGNSNGVLTYQEFKDAFMKGQEPPEEEEAEEEAAERRRRRHLLSWVWVPGEGAEYDHAVKPFPRKEFFGTSLATMQRVAVSMADCKKMAIKDACEEIGKCQQPVCSSDIMYNNTKIEALCGMCLLAGQQSEAGGKSAGCFALDAKVDILGAGTRSMAELVAGEKIAAVTRHGSLEYSRVLFTHEHTASYSTVKLAVGDDVMELTSDHQMPLYTRECGPSYCHSARLVKAKHVAIGDRLYISDGNGSTVGTVSATSKGQARVKYVVTESGNLIVNGVVASVFSTMARHFETLPFCFLDKLFPGIFEWAPVKAALYAVLESPALAYAEGIVDVLMSFKASFAVPQQRAAALWASVPLSW